MNDFKNKYDFQIKDIIKHEMEKTFQKLKATDLKIITYN